MKKTQIESRNYKKNLRNWIEEENMNNKRLVMKMTVFPKQQEKITYGHSYENNRVEIDE